MSGSQGRGSCLCGAVRYEIDDNLGIFQYCHCSRCRKFTGSAFASNLMVKPEHFRWLQGEESVGTYDLKEAKYFATAFCRICGSSLPWHSKSGKAVIVPAGTLDESPDIKPTKNIFCGSRGDWYVEPDALPQHDEMPPRR